MNKVSTGDFICPTPFYITPKKNDHRWQPFLGDYEKESLLGLFIV
jgi:hypothetical protein